MRWRWLRLPLLLLATAPAAAAQDFQSWNEVDFTAAWKHASLMVPLVARTQADAPNPQLAGTGLFVDVSVVKHLVATGGYLFVDLPQSVGGVQLPLAAVTGVLGFKRFELTDRNRFEKLYGYGTAPVRYRNRALLDWKPDRNGRWHLFVDDELFWNLSNGTWNQNRLQAGAGMRMGSRLGLDLYYLQKNPAGSATTYVLGTDLKVTLRSK